MHGTERAEVDPRGTGEWVMIGETEKTGTENEIAIVGKVTAIAEVTGVVNDVIACQSLTEIFLSAIQPKLRVHSPPSCR